MVRNTTNAAIRQMYEELDRLEAQGRRELKDRNTRAVGTLRMDLVQECRRRLCFIATMVPKDPRGSG
jgi:hypothetical protein